MTSPRNDRSESDRESEWWAPEGTSPLGRENRVRKRETTDCGRGAAGSAAMGAVGEAMEGVVVEVVASAPKRDIGSERAGIGVEVPDEGNDGGLPSGLSQDEGESDAGGTAAATLGVGDGASATSELSSSETAA